MAVRLNHTIIAAHDRLTSATFLAEMLGLPQPEVLGPFAMVFVGDTSLDYMDVKEYRSTTEIAPQHYAFLVTEAEFDEIFARIRERDLPYWADPYQRESNRINDWDGGRGVYFEDPNGHLLEAITRPYGSGGTTTSRPHPLLAAKERRFDQEESNVRTQLTTEKQVGPLDDEYRRVEFRRNRSEPVR